MRVNRSEKKEENRRRNKRGKAEAFPTIATQEEEEEEGWLGCHGPARIERKPARLRPTLLCVILTCECTHTHMSTRESGGRRGRCYGTVPKAIRCLDVVIVTTEPAKTLLLFKGGWKLL